MSGTSIKVSTAHLAASRKAAEQRLLVHLLNVALRQDVTADCDWHNGRKFVYFRATADLAPRRIRGGSGRQRLVFNPKYKDSAPTEIRYCQHAALEWQFLLADGQWLCALTPTYHYTRDGYRESRYASGRPGSSGSNATRRSTSRPGCGPPTCTAGTQNPIPGGNPRVRDLRGLRRRPGYR